MIGRIKIEYKKLIKNDKIKDILCISTLIKFYIENI